MSGDIYKNETRIRVNGLLINEESIVLAQIKSPVNDRLIWMPPGGGLEFGESMKQCLRREFREETGLEIHVGDLVAVNELVKPPFHAIEFYFKVGKKSGTLSVGADPEHTEDEQLLRDLQWIPLNELNEIEVAPKPLQEWITAANSTNQKQNLYFQT